MYEDDNEYVSPNSADKLYNGGTPAKYKTTTQDVTKSGSTPANKEELFDIEAEARKMKLNMGANDNKEASKSMIKCLL